MFACEIQFRDGVSAPEIVLLRRSSAVIGSGEHAHLVIEGSASLPFDLFLARSGGRDFACRLAERGSGVFPSPSLVEGVHSEDVEVELGSVVLHITALDSDVRLQDKESLDGAGLRILRAALSSPSPTFPAVALLGSEPVIVSFQEGSSILVGRARGSDLRFDASSVSSQHACVGYTDGEFWVEDLGSSNGTYLNGVRISGRQKFDALESVAIAKEFFITGVENFEDVAQLSLISVPRIGGGQGIAPGEKVFSELNSRLDSEGKPSVSSGASKDSFLFQSTDGHAESPQRRSKDDLFPADGQQRFPAVVSMAETVHPSRFVLPKNREVFVGRDSEGDIWVNNSHVSRRHLRLFLRHDGVVELTDMSSNGTFLKTARLNSDVPIEVRPDLQVFDLQEGVTLGICFTDVAERQFWGEEIAKEEASESAEPSIISDSYGARSKAPDKAPRENTFSESPKRAISPVENRAGGSSVSRSVFQLLAEREDNALRGGEEGTNKPFAVKDLVEELSPERPQSAQAPRREQFATSSPPLRDEPFHEEMYEAPETGRFNRYFLIGGIGGLIIIVFLLIFFMVGANLFRY